MVHFEFEFTLRRNYLTILEVGGAYAHRFAGLLGFLAIPYLVITDLDSVDPQDNRKVCRADKPGAVTSNASLKSFLDKSLITELIAMDIEEQKLAGNTCFVAYQKITSVAGHPPDSPMIGRTFEETFTYENMQLFRDGVISLGTEMPVSQDFEEEYKTIFEKVKSSSFKKTEFALTVASSASEWVVPQYIADGLCWLETKLSPQAP